MKIRNLGLVCVLAPLAAFGAFAAACGGGSDQLTMEEFFTRVQTLDDQFSEDGDALDARFNDLTADSSVEDATDLFNDQIDLIDAFVEDLADLNAPPEAQAVQDEAVTAGREVVQAFRDALDEASDAETIDDFAVIFNSDELNTTFDRFDQACVAAETMAIDNGITVDYSCGE